MPEYKINISSCYASNTFFTTVNLLEKSFICPIHEMDLDDYSREEYLVAVNRQKSFVSFTLNSLSKFYNLLNDTVRGEELGKSFMTDDLSQVLMIKKVSIGENVKTIFIFIQ